MKKILFIGQFNDASGYGSASRRYLDTFIASNISEEYELKILSVSFENTIELNPSQKKYVVPDIKSYIQENSGEYICMAHLLPNIMECNAELNLILKNSLKNFSLIAWETTKLPKHWNEIYASKIYSGIIVPSQWNREIVESEQNLPVYLLPFPMDVLNSFIREKTEEFNVLCISQWSQRKGFDILIQAFCSEFFYNEDARLTIKSYAATPGSCSSVLDSEYLVSEVKKNKDKIFDYNNRPKCKVTVIPGLISREKLDELYLKANVFCLPTRGEGFSLPIYEAAAKGLPVIAPTIGGHIDNLDTSLLCDSRLQTVTGLNNFYSSINMKGVEPNFESVRERLRECYESWKSDSKLLLTSGQLNQELVRQNLNSKKIYEQFKAIVDE